MEYQITTSAGITTVDSLCTIGTLTRRLRGIGVAHIKAADITRPDRSLVRTAANMRGMSEDEYLERFARRSAAEISRLSPNQNQSSSAANGR